MKYSVSQTHELKKLHGFCLFLNHFWLNAKSVRKGNKPPNALTRIHRLSINIHSGVAMLPTSVIQLRKADL